MSALRRFAGELVRFNHEGVPLAYDAAGPIGVPPPHAVQIPSSYVHSAERSLIELASIFEALQLRHAAVENIEARIRRIDRVLAMIRHQECRQ